MAKRIQIIDDVTGVVTFDETADLDALVAAANPQFVQVTKTLAYTLTPTSTNVTFDSSDIESDTAVIDHDAVNTERIILKEDVYFEGSIDFQFDNQFTNTRVVTIELFKNNTTLISSIDIAMEKSSHKTIHRALVIPPALFVVDDYLNIKLSVDSVSGIGDMFLVAGARVIMKKMK